MSAGAADLHHAPMYDEEQDFAEHRAEIDGMVGVLASIGCGSFAI